MKDTNFVKCFVDSSDRVLGIVTNNIDKVNTTLSNVIEVFGIDFRIYGVEIENYNDVQMLFYNEDWTYVVGVLVRRSY